MVFIIHKINELYTTNIPRSVNWQIYLNNFLNTAAGAANVKFINARISNLFLS